MPKYTYLIIGGGMTADAAVHGIREVDPNNSIGLISSEEHPPYDRPPLSKKLWKGTPLESIWRHTDKQGVTLHLGCTVRRLDVQGKCVVDSHGDVYEYNSLLLATGGSPRRLSFGGEQIIYYRTLNDYQRLRLLTSTSQHIAVIGGGFIGSEIAAALALNGKSVTMAFPEVAIGARAFPADLSSFLNDYYRQKGVQVLPGQSVIGLDTLHGQSILKIRDTQSQSEREIETDGVIAGIGIQPNVELAQAAGLTVENGIHVDSSLRTSQADVYAAGDVANFYCPSLEKRMRVEHEDNANTMGHLAGQAMAGRRVTYDHLPSFYSDLFDLGYEAVGELNSRLQTVADWKQPYREGVIYYLRDQRVRGVLLWNVWEQVDAARNLIAEPGPIHPESLIGRIPT